MSRDWTSTLWPASFNGVPFYVQRADRAGRRRLVVHEFPFRDEPLIQDMGSGAGKIMVEAYQLSDSADSQAKGLESALGAGGRGMLVLPDIGMVMARAEEWKPVYDMEKLGYIGWSITFVRDSGAGGISSLFYQVAEIFAAAEALGSLAFSVLSDVEAAGLPGMVSSTAVTSFQQGLAALSVISSSEVIDASTASSVNVQLQQLYSAATTAFSSASTAGALGSAMVDVTRAISDGMDPNSVGRAFSPLLDQAAVSASMVPVAALSISQPWYGTVSQQAMTRNAVRIAVALRLAAIAAYADAIARQTFISRQDGINARAVMTDRLDIAMQEATGGELIDVYEAVSSLQGQLAAYLSAEITTLAPIVTVSAGASLPALVWSWRLYSDPNRAGEIADRNGVVHPLFMPQQFEALRW